MSKDRRLGRGLAALLGTPVDEAGQPIDAPAAPSQPAPAQSVAPPADAGKQPDAQPAPAGTVITSGGIHGTVAAVEEGSLLLKVAENVKIRVSKSSVAGPVAGDDTPSAS